MFYTVFLCIGSFFTTSLTVGYLNTWSFGKWYVLILFAIAIFKHITERRKYE